jgi:DNA-binding response OmpR family regulator
MKILVADDDLDQLTLRCLLLEQSGFQTLQASDPGSALAIAEAEKPDCAVLDLCFPNPESGYRLVRELKALDSAIRLVLLTGAQPARFANRSETELIDEIVQKGLGSANLVRKLRKLEQQV